MAERRVAKLVETTADNSADCWVDSLAALTELMSVGTMVEL